MGRVCACSLRSRHVMRKIQPELVKLFHGMTMNLCKLYTRTLMMHKLTALHLILKLDTEAHFELFFCIYIKLHTTVDLQLNLNPGAILFLVGFL